MKDFAEKITDKVGSAFSSINNRSERSGTLLIEQSAAGALLIAVHWGTNQRET